MRVITYKFISIFCLVLNTNCHVDRYELTKEELIIQEELKKEFNCNKIEFRHDAEAIVQEQNDGIFDVTLCDTFCQMDSVTISFNTVKMANKIIPVLSHNENYKYLTFYTSKTTPFLPKTTKLTCQKTITFLICEPNKIYTLE